jgi:hypothetical protein
MVISYGADIAYIKVQKEYRRNEMLRNNEQLMAWPEDPAWPDPFGDDPYDISL